jgi:hypothetical protein
MKVGDTDGEASKLFAERRAWVLAMCFCALLICGLSAVSVVSARSPVRFKGASGRAQVRPTTLYLTGDGTLTDVKVHWSSWGGRVAIGHGIADWHGCTPNCAQGTRHRDPATVRLFRIKTCNGRRYYARATTVTARGRRFRLGSFAPC